MWLIEGGLGPALVALPVDWTGAQVAKMARRWFQRLRRTDDLSRLVRAATGTSAGLTDTEFSAVRRLLEDEQTWSLAGRGSIEDLATLIMSCLPSRDDRTGDDSRTAARTIARGLIEFAVTDLDPKLFQQILLARLERIKTAQGNALDEAMLALNADLIAGFTAVMRELESVVDRLPPGAARQLEIAAYLRTLISWLNSDPWPQDRQFGGPVLTPAAIERKLRMIDWNQSGGQVVDADEVAQRCQRLVVLGGPGSGKTWLARRTVRQCAEHALQALATGETLDEVELPLYTTCSRLFNAAGDIREAVVSSALDQLADLGGARMRAALQRFFTERNAPAVLVVDSLDEAHGSDERLRQADTLPWRIVLTSRPSAWNHQLAMNGGDDSRRVGELQPLYYPDDVESFIGNWFAQQAEWGNDLAGQIARRPDLKKAATVPLILAFYCIVGGGTPLPEFRRDLYASVLRRLLTGRWRGNYDHQPDVDRCLRTLRDWAWSGAAVINGVSGTGAWEDDIPIRPGRPGGAFDNAADHVAMPVGPPDVDDGTIRRRFIHRSIREHLVAEHIAKLPVNQAADILLPHLWYDPDWEYTAPSAIAMHPRHDQLLQKLICRASRSDDMPRSLSGIDAGRQFRTLLARIAADSDETDWCTELAEVIGRARIDLAWSGRFDDLDSAASWETSNCQIRKALMALLTDVPDGLVAEWSARWLIYLRPTDEDKRRARKVVLDLLARETRVRQVAGLVDALMRLDPTEQDKKRAREVVLDLLACGTSVRQVAGLVDALMRLDPTEQDERRVREYNARRFAGTLRSLLDPQAGSKDVPELAREAIRLAVMPGQEHQVRKALLGLLARQTDGPAAATMAGALAQLDPAADDQRQAREALLGLLARQKNSTAASELAGSLIRLEPTADDKGRARETLLALLARQTDGTAATTMAGALAQLDPAADDRRQAREAMLGLLAHETNGWRAVDLTGGLIQLDPPPDAQRQAREALLGLLGRQRNGMAASELAGGLTRLEPTAGDKRRARETLLALLALQTNGPAAAQMAVAVAQLDPTADDKRRARESLLVLMPRQTDDWVTSQLMKAMTKLSPTVNDLSTWPSWTVPPTPELLTAVRQNSALASWLAALPSLAGLS
jgi:hypothetical protein